MTKHSKVLFLLAFGAVIAAAGYAYAKTCFIVGNCGGSVTNKEQVNPPKRCTELGYQTVATCKNSGGVGDDGKTAKWVPAGKKIGECWEKCACNEDYYPFQEDSNHGKAHSDGKKYVLSDQCIVNGKEYGLYHTKVCNNKYVYTASMNNSISGSGNYCQVNSTDAKKYDAYTCPGEKRKVGDSAGGFIITRGNNTSTDPGFTAICYEARNCASINGSYHEQVPANTSGWKMDAQFNAQKVGKKGSTIYDTTQTAICYTWKKKECSDWTVVSTTLTSNSSCSEGYKSKSETVKIGDEDKTCYRCISKGCSDYSDNGVTYQDSNSCSDGYKAVKKTVKLGSSDGTCYKCEAKTCGDYGYKAARDDCSYGVEERTVKLGSENKKCFECKSASSSGDGSGGGSGSSSGGGSGGSGASGTCKLTILGGSCANCGCSDVTIKTPDGQSRFGCSVQNLEVPAGNVWIEGDTGAYAGKHCLNSSNYNAGGSKSVSCKGTQTYYVVLCPGAY